MIDIGEGTKLTTTYNWFQDKEVIDNFLLSIDEIANDLPAEVHLLGIGSGVGNLDYAVKEHLENKYSKKVLLTLSDRMVNDTRTAEDTIVVEVDNKSLPFDANNFDLVIARSVTHYEKDNEDETKVLTEIKRVLKDNGVFITEAPYFQEKKEAQFHYKLSSLISKYMNLKTFTELMDLHQQVFSKVNLSIHQPEKPLTVTKKDFANRYDITDTVAQQSLELIREYVQNGGSNVWTKENDFGWSVNFTTLICRK